MPKTPTLSDPQTQGVSSVETQDGTAMSLDTAIFTAKNAMDIGGKIATANRKRQGNKLQGEVLDSLINLENQASADFDAYEGGGAYASYMSKAGITAEDFTAASDAEKRYFVENAKLEARADQGVLPAQRFEIEKEKLLRSYIRANPAYSNEILSIYGAFNKSSAVSTILNTKQALVQAQDAEKKELYKKQRELGAELGVDLDGELWMNDRDEFYRQLTPKVDARERTIELQRMTERRDAQGAYTASQAREYANENMGNAVIEAETHINSILRDQFGIVDLDKASDLDPAELDRLKLTLQSGLVAFLRDQREVFRTTGSQSGFDGASGAHYISDEEWAKMYEPVAQLYTVAQELVGTDKAAGTLKNVVNISKDKALARVPNVGTVLAAADIAGRMGKSLAGTRTGVVTDAYLANATVTLLEVSQTSDNGGDSGGDSPPAVSSWSEAVGEHSYSEYTKKGGGLSRDAFMENAAVKTLDTAYDLITAPEGVIPEDKVDKYAKNSVSLLFKDYYDKAQRGEKLQSREVTDGLLRVAAAPAFFDIWSKMSPEDQTVHGEVAREAINYHWNYMMKEEAGFYEGVLLKDLVTTFPHHGNRPSVPSDPMGRWAHQTVTNQIDAHTFVDNAGNPLRAGDMLTVIRTGDSNDNLQVQWAIREDAFSGATFDKQNSQARQQLELMVAKLNTRMSPRMTQLVKANAHFNPDYNVNGKPNYDASLTLLSSSLLSGIR